MLKSHTDYEKLSRFLENKLALVKLFQNLGYSVRTDFAYSEIGNPTDVFVEELKLAIDVDLEMNSDDSLPELIEIDEEEITKRFYYTVFNPRTMTARQISEVIRHCIENPVPDMPIEEDFGQVK